MPHARRRDLANRHWWRQAPGGLREAAASLRGMGSVEMRSASPARCGRAPIESLSFGHIILAGLPLPVCQVA